MTSKAEEASVMGAVLRGADFDLDFDMMGSNRMGEGRRKATVFRRKGRQAGEAAKRPGRARKVC